MVITNEVRSRVFDHIGRYRIAVPSLIASTEVFSGASMKTVKECLQTFVEEGTLKSSLLRPESKKSEPYYFYSARTAAKLGFDLQWSQPLQREHRADYFAAASFCCGSDVFREVMTKKEFSERFANLWFPGQPVRYYLEPVENQAVRLSYVKVDTNSEGHWGRLIDGCFRFLNKRTDARHAPPEHRQKIENYAVLLRQNLFQFTVLTALPEKKRAIELELERRRTLGEPVVPMQVHVIPGLFELLFPPHAAVAR